ncbi:MAG: uncharacterized protein V7607_6590 [Solirubrobacteraceae bacterium]
MSRSRCLLVASSIALLLPASAVAQQPAPGRTVEAAGVASVKVKAPSDRKHEAPIRAAVETAEAKALPRAMADARSKAADLARLAGLALGGIEAISDTSSSVYGPFFYGTFGPGRFCGTIRTVIFKRGKDGKRHRVGTRTRHTCRVPPTVTSTVSVTFAAT